MSLPRPTPSPGGPADLPSGGFPRNAVPDAPSGGPARNAVPDAPVGVGEDSDLRFRPARMRRSGTTLLEVVTVLLLVGLLLSFILPPLRGRADRAAVRGAREAVVALLVRTRAEALSGGGAALGVDPAGDSVWVESSGEVRRVLRVDEAFGADLGPPGTPLARLRFGPLGVGLATSRTLSLERGAATERLTVSSYGRVKRW